MNVASKIATGTLGLGGVAGGGFLASQYLPKESKSTLSHKLQEEGFSPLVRNHSQWSKTLEEYNKVKDKGDEAFEVSTVALNEDQLKDKCESLLRKESYSEVEKAKAIRWCTDPISIQSRIDKLGRRSLNDTDSDSTDKTTWTELVKKYLSDGAQNKLSVTIDTLQGDAQVDDTRINKLREGCRGLKDKTSIEKDYLSNYSKFSDWCSVPK
ncbi:hypothetical protein HF1_04390 [Mycoplasma haemofelis str. Langford 1]|uniref:Uncharacterized protein n=1 Tax=Mycoplasma haemofelis (strain Langford 1) TaxID=941640 RepID=E8ZH26_MYCHL|nr:hypothetical protein [Mycoplasma haemofelis]CBY92447.1 hypothetical protein HF1_04390 [Mycoplasma haemofelis str. Langford 1]